MNKFLETCNLPKLNEEEAQSLNGLITTTGIESVIKKLMAHKCPGPDGFTGEFYKTFQEELNPIILRLLKKKKSKMSEVIKRSYTMRKGESSQGCKDGTIFTNQ